MCSFGSTGGGCCTWLFHIKQKILDTTACFPLFQHTAFYFPPSSMVPLSLQRGKRAACFPFVELLNSYLYTREHSALFLQSLRIARSRESVQDSCRPMSLGSYRPANLMIRTDSKHSLRLFDMSFFLVTRLLNARICLFRTDSEQSSRPFVFVLKGKRNGSRAEV